ncbi:D-cysteine desulfhydrase [soil metagenome]
MYDLSWLDTAGPARVELATLPTPLHRADRLSERLGVPIWFKRDDLTGLGLGGNKVRTLEYLMADALGNGCDCLVTGAGPQSNWTLLAALAAIRTGLEPFVVCYGDEPPAWGNLLLHRRLGVALSFTGDPDRASVDAAIESWAADLRAAGRRPYVVPRGGATPVGALGYLRGGLELASQLDGPTTLWQATGSGGTTAGLVAASALGASYTVAGVTVSRPVAEISARVGELVGAALGLVGVRSGVPDVDIRDGWIGPGYGVPSPEGDEAARLVARTEGVFLDPVFGAKAMAALIAVAHAGQVDGPVVFLVSGGAPTLFGSAP